MQLDPCDSDRPPETCLPLVQTPSRECDVEIPSRSNSWKITGCVRYLVLSFTCIFEISVSTSEHLCSVIAVNHYMMISKMFKANDA